MKKTKLYVEFSWEEFLERYIVNHEEFIFHFGNQEINICYGKSGSFSYNIILNKNKVREEEFYSPEELLKKAKFDGKSLKEIWKELE